MQRTEDIDIRDVFMGRGFTSGGQESGSVFGAAVCKIQGSKWYVESLPLVLKDKRSWFSQGKRSAVQLPLITCMPSGSRTLNWYLKRLQTGSWRHSSLLICSRWSHHVTFLGLTVWHNNYADAQKVTIIGLRCQHFFCFLELWVCFKICCLWTC